MSNATVTNRKTTFDADTNADIPTRSTAKSGFEVQHVIVDFGGTGAESTTLPLVFQNAGSATRSQVADSATDVLLLAANTSRLGASVFNDSSAVLFLGLGSTAVTTSNYTCKLYQFQYYDAPKNFTGQIRGIWATDPNDGGAKVTELT